MKWVSWKERKKIRRKQQLTPHKRFAWYPIKIKARGTIVPEHWVWLEYVEAKWVPHHEDSEWWSKYGEMEYLGTWVGPAHA